MASFDEIRKQFKQANKGKNIHMDSRFAASGLGSFETEFKRNRRGGETEQQFRRRRARESAIRKSKVGGT